ncbi:MAG: diguanylate cyclase [Vicinamibacteria bacterium]|nr:diguanylate cyclase [Vicinamibacteria bacterium]
MLSTRDAELAHAFVEASSDALIVADDRGRILFANASAEALLGHEPGSLRSHEVDELVPARFHQHRQQREEFAADPHPRPMGRGLELFARHAAGHEIPVDIALTPIVVGGRRLIGCALRDLRGRSQGPDALRIQATALRSAANGIVITDKQGYITWVNPAACTITGYRAFELIGQHTRILKSGHHDPAFYKAIWETITRGETWSGTIVNRRKDGTLCDEQQTIAPVSDDQGWVTHFIAIKQDVTEQRRTQSALAAAHAELAARLVEIESLNSMLREQAVRDPLTGLHNRRFLHESIEREIARAARSGQPMAVVALDLDHFKAVNDVHGHAAGDAVLRHVGLLLRSHVRASDLACRTGGEEFAVVLPGSPLPIALDRAEAWRTALAAAPVETAGTAVACTMSVGVALLHAEGETFEQCWARADGALYRAKQQGRNRVVCAED